MYEENRIGNKNINYDRKLSFESVSYKLNEILINIIRKYIQEMTDNLIHKEKFLNNFISKIDLSKENEKKNCLCFSELNKINKKSIFLINDLVYEVDEWIENYMKNVELFGTVFTSKKFTINKEINLELLNKKNKDNGQNKIFNDEIKNGQEKTQLQGNIIKIAASSVQNNNNNNQIFLQNEMNNSNLISNCIDNVTNNLNFDSIPIVPPNMINFSNQDLTRRIQFPGGKQFISPFRTNKSNFSSVHFNLNGEIDNNNRNLNTVGSNYVIPANFFYNNIINQYRNLSTINNIIAENKFD